MALSPEEIEQAHILLVTYQRRLRVRDKQIARYGDNVDPEIVLDAEDLRRLIRATKAVLTPDLPDELSGLVRRRLEDDYFIFQATLEAKEDVAILREDVAAMKTQQSLAATWRMQADEKFDNLFVVAQSSEQARASGAPLLRRVMVAALFIGICGLVVGCIALSLSLGGP